MLYLSTSCKSKEINNGELLIDAMKRFNIDGIELEYRIDEATFHQLRNPLKRSGLKVASIHNFFPIPADFPGLVGSGDLFLLSHPDKEERQKAVKWTIRTIEHANALEASAIVLHCGYIQMNTQLETLYLYYIGDQIDSPEARTFLRYKLEEMDQLKKQYIDSLLLSLDTLAPVAEAQNINIGIENRYHYHELPGLDDFQILFEHFKGSPIGYWHDTGHAHANEVLKIIPENELLNRYSDHLIGIHLHDAQGLDDHLAPGKGEINFNRIKSYLNEDTLLVIELKPGTADTEISRGIEFVRENILD